MCPRLAVKERAGYMEEEPSTTATSTLLPQQSLPSAQTHPQGSGTDPDGFPFTSPITKLSSQGVLVE